MIAVASAEVVPAALDSRGCRCRRRLRPRPRPVVVSSFGAPGGKRSFGPDGTGGCRPAGSGEEGTHCCGVEVEHLPAGEPALVHPVEAEHWAVEALRGRGSGRAAATARQPPARRRRPPAGQAAGGRRWAAASPSRPPSLRRARQAHGWCRRRAGTAAGRTRRPAGRPGRGHHCHAARPRQTQPGPLRHSVCWWSSCRPFPCRPLSRGQPAPAPRPGRPGCHRPVSARGCFYPAASSSSRTGAPASRPGWLQCGTLSDEWSSYQDHWHTEMMYQLRQESVRPERPRLFVRDAGIAADRRGDTARHVDHHAAPRRARLMGAHPQGTRACRGLTAWGAGDGEGDGHRRMFIGCRLPQGGQASAAAVGDAGPPRQPAGPVVPRSGPGRRGGLRRVGSPEKVAESGDRGAVASPGRGSVADD